MVDLTTQYMGLRLKNPIIAGASSLTADLDSIKNIERAGAAAIVTKSLFEEEIQIERFKFDEDLEKYNDRHAEMTTIFPHLEHAGSKEHLYWVKKTKDAVSIPVIASLNAVNGETWIEYAQQLEGTGVDGLELNFFAVPKQFDLEGAAIEKEQLNILKQIKKHISIPVSVKLSALYSNPLNFINQLDKIGVDGFVLFNRFFEPDIDVNKQKNRFPFNLSDRTDNRFPLRFAGLLYDHLEGDICSSTGIYEAEDVIKMLLAGAQCVQVVSTLYKNNIYQITKMLDQMTEWMKQKEYSSIDDFRGKLSKENATDPWAYTRAQYVRLLLNPDEIVNNFPVV
ncbi:dihydroorotate dehydrogenase-like protein [candidate division KSB1 bacterium]|nr:dihydroorotate dehydrogenase-like protein [candidate division KSB1 bacterium]